MFLTFAQNMDCGYKLEPPHASICTPDLCFEQKKENYHNFYLKIVVFTSVKNCSILHRHVIVMEWNI